MSTEVVALSRVWFAQGSAVFARLFARPEAAPIAFSPMTGFGGALRDFRRAQGLTQQGLADALGGAFARSTLANIEAGRELPSPRLWDSLVRALPSSEAALGPAYEHVRRVVAQPVAQGRPSLSGSATLGGPFTVDRLELAYVFRESRTPEEILETRTVRSLADGADNYVLKVKAQASTAFSASAEVLWGGHISESERRDPTGQVIYLRRLQFDRKLRKGERHSFALRSWIERDPEPDTSVAVLLTIPADVVAIHLAFLGSRPKSLWRYDRVTDEALAPRSANEPFAEPVALGPDGHCSAIFRRPPLGVEFGIGWAWE